MNNLIIQWRMQNRFNYVITKNLMNHPSALLHITYMHSVPYNIRFLPLSKMRWS
ncbi:hypothetical protein MtrunA17_Chr8g0352121 [Medicago truncatula]|uniref:Uncharacterized protein n=1 Tax=Medicago truncatula TaxID=3880 RepID=A0A396GHZ1_MEDTR|nr:hypothetical protein MtrunA17_Chr8g0352121 [Medicago truncatula]